MFFTVYIRNRAEAINMCEAAFQEGRFHMISISTPGRTYMGWPRKSQSVLDVLRVAFYDVSDHDPSGLPAITTLQARDIARFILTHAGPDTDFIVHCDSGVSRSAGVARAIQEYYGLPDECIDSCRDIQPNYIVYRAVLDQLYETAGHLQAPPHGQSVRS